MRPYSPGFRPYTFWTRRSCAPALDSRLAWTPWVWHRPPVPGLIGRGLAGYGRPRRSRSALQSRHSLPRGVLRGLVIASLLLLQPLAQGFECLAAVRAVLGHQLPFRCGCVASARREVKLRPQTPHGYGLVESRSFSTSKAGGYGARRPVDVYCFSRNFPAIGLGLATSRTVRASPPARAAR